MLLAYAKRSLTGRAAGLRRCPTTPTSRATCAATSRRAVVERFGHLLARAPAAPRARGDASSPTTSSTRSGPTFVSRPRRRAGRRAGRRRARLPHRPRRHRRRGALGRPSRGSARRRPPRRSGAHATASTTLVEATARWYLENAARRRPRARRSPPGARASGACAALPELALGSDGARAASGRAELVEQRRARGAGARATPSCRRWRHAPDVIAAAAGGRPRRSRTPARGVRRCSRTALQLAWLEEQLDALPVSTRMQRWALQALRDDLWRARRELAAARAARRRRARRCEDAVDAFVEARPDAHAAPRRPGADDGGRGRRRPRRPDPGRQAAARARELRPRSRGRRARTTKPRPIGPARSSPPHSATRSRIPISPCPPPARPLARGPPRRSGWRPRPPAAPATSAG